MTIHKTTYTTVYQFLRDPAEGESVRLNYQPVNPKGSVQTVDGTIDESFLTEWTLVRVDADVSYAVAGNGLEQRDVGEVVKRTADVDRRVGHFLYAERVDE